MKVKVSVIIPVYNVEKYLRQCIESVLRQTLKELEIIIVDDGSPDKCGEIIDSYAKKDKRIIAIHQKNSGYSKSVNLGIKKAKGEYIGIVESDDFIEPDMYEALYKNAKKLKSEVTKGMFFSYNSTVVTGLQNKVYKNPTVDLRDAPDEAFSVTKWPNILGFHASIWSSIYKADFIKKILVPETAGASYQDFPFMVEVMCKAKRISVVKRPFYHWRWEPNQKNSTSARGKKLLLMAENSKRALDIAKKYKVLDEVREPLFAHFMWANYPFFDKISFKYKKMYYQKLVDLFSEINDDPSFEYSFFTYYDRKTMRYFNSKHGLVTYYIKTTFYKIKSALKNTFAFIFPTYRAVSFIKAQNFELAEQSEVLMTEVLSLRRDIKSKNNKTK